MKIKKINYKTLYDKKGNQAAIVLSFKEFQKIIDRIEDLRDSYIVYRETSKKLETTPIEKIRG